MSRIHIIYDPDDRLETQHDGLQKTGVKVAIMPIAPNLNAQELYDVIERTADLLLEQVYPGGE